MPVRISTLAAKLIADTSGFKTGFAGASATLKSFAGTLGVTFGAGAIVAGIKGQIDALDELAESAQKIGTTTEVLSGLGLALKQNSVDSDQLAKAAARLNIALAESPEKFSALGLSAEQLVGLDLQGRLGTIGDALSKLNAEARSAAVTDLFGKAGTELLPLLLQGTEGLRKSVEQVRAMGGIVSTEDAKRASDAADAWDRVSQSFSSVLRNAAVLLAPLMEEIARSLEDLFRALGLAAPDASNPNAARTGGGWWGAAQRGWAQLPPAARDVGASIQESLGFSEAAAETREWAAAFRAAIAEGTPQHQREMLAQQKQQTLATQAVADSLGVAKIR